MPLLGFHGSTLPSLKTYTIVSVAFMVCSFCYTSYTANERLANANDTIAEPSLELPDFLFKGSPKSLPAKIRNETLSRMRDAARLMIREPFSVWSLVNMAYCILLLVGVFIQRVVFGELRVTEQQNIKDKFWHFLFYRFIFVFGIINVQYIHEIVFWCAWFSMLGFVNLLAQLGKDRFEYLSFSMNNSNWCHVRVLGLMVGVFALSLLLLLLCVVVGVFAGTNIFTFMIAECVQLNIRILHVVLKYAVYLWDVNRGDDVPVLSWEKRGTVTYYAELSIELVLLLLEFFHNLHMLLWSNILLSIGSLVICMQLRHIFLEIHMRLQRHQNNQWVLDHIRKNYPLATREELKVHEDNCAICWEAMNQARKLPCGHMFHAICLQSWLEQDTSCPTCRTLLSFRRRNYADSAANSHGFFDPLGNSRSLPHNFFNFDGSNHASWVSAFSVDVGHIHVRNHAHVFPMHTFQIRNVAHQIHQLFPRYPVSVIADDLSLTRSVEITIENILDGRVPLQDGGDGGESTVVSQVSDSESDGYDHEGVDGGDHRSRRLQLEALGSTLTRATQRSLIREEFRMGGDSVGNAELRSSLEEPGTSDREAKGNAGPVWDGRFASSSNERQIFLQKRKEDLLLEARRRYLAKRTLTPARWQDHGEDC